MNVFVNIPSTNSQLNVPVLARFIAQFPETKSIGITWFDHSSLLQECFSSSTRVAPRLRRSAISRVTLRPCTSLNSQCGQHKYTFVPLMNVLPLPESVHLDRIVADPLSFNQNCKRIE